MKKILLAASVVALLTVSCNKQNKAPESTTPSESVAAVTSGQIAFIQLDSLINHYNMYIDLRTAYEAKAQKADQELTALGRGLERDIQDYQEKVQKGLVTRSQAQTLEESLNTKQQNFVQRRDQVMGNLAEEEQVMLNQIHHAITEYVNEFNSDKRYSMILSSSAAGPVINADPSLDLTNMILEGLNKKYAASAAAKK